MNWTEELKTNIRKVEDFRRFYKALDINQDEIADVEASIKTFGINIPRRYLTDLIAAASTEKELSQVRRLITPGLNPIIKDNKPEGVIFVESTDQDHNPLKGLTRMYPDRVLVSPTQHCMVNCQWCFRTKITDSFLSSTELDLIYEYIRNDKKITDVIITGGEPLLATDRKLEQILSKLRSINHVDIIRFHTRATVVLPSRIDKDFLSLIQNYSKKGKPIYIVTHFVHPFELSDASTDALDSLANIGVPIFNQAPVLAGINDDQKTFDEWNKRMIKYKVKPYYVASPVILDGANSRFYVPIHQVEELLKNYSKKYDGLGRPTLIVPVMGAKLTPSELKDLMDKHGTYVRRTKIEIL